MQRSEQSWGKFGVLIGARPRLGSLWWKKYCVHAFAGPPNLKEIALEAGVHPAHMKRAFRAHFGMPLRSYLRQRRLEWAARQVVETEAPLAQIAFEAGFADESHFTRLFRIYTGMTPARYRQSRRRR